LQLDRINISPHGIREGVLLVYERYGVRWLEQVKAEAAGEGAKGESEVARPDESFVNFGRKALQERTRDLLKWRRTVLKRDDIEAVHKMRVASRRLRAVLDAYQPICDPRPFAKAYRQIKKTANILGKARDTDVMIQHLQESHQSPPDEEKRGRDWLIERLGVYRELQQRELEAFFKKLDDEDLQRQTEASLPQDNADHGKG
jgi:CHAD domain-containing protein